MGALGALGAAGLVFYRSLKLSLPAFSIGLSRYSMTRRLPVLISAVIFIPGASLIRLPSTSIWVCCSLSVAGPSLIQIQLSARRFVAGIQRVSYPVEIGVADFLDAGELVVAGVVLTIDCWTQNAVGKEYRDGIGCLVQLLFGERAFAA